MSQPQTVAIIGAGLSGLALALALDQQGIKSTIYESRPEPLNIGGAVMLSPNALRIFDTLGIYNSIKTQGYNFDDLEFRTISGDLIDSYEFGGEPEYGYRANRIYRYELIDLLLAAIHKRSIPIMYGKKFSKITSESPDSVTFSFTDATTATATFIIGADGIHSTVRRYLYPSATHAPKFIGQAGITASIPASNLPPTLRPTKPVTIMTKSQGAFVLAPQKPDASEYLIGKQKRIPTKPAPTREEWDAIHADKQASIDFLQSSNEIYGSLAVAATTQISRDKVNIWPFFVVPKLENWASQLGRVILVGDAAHAIPPSAGQGISQAMEDVYMLALLMGSLARGVSEDKDSVKMKNAVLFWQGFRQERIERVLGVNARVDARRLPKEEGTAVTGTEVEKEGWDLGWLYSVDIKSEVEKWVKQQQ